MSFPIISPLRQRPAALTREEIGRLFPSEGSVAFVMAISAEDAAVDAALQKIAIDLAESHLAVLRFIQPEELGRLMFEPPGRLAALVMAKGDWTSISRSLAIAWTRHLPGADKSVGWEQYGVIVPEPVRRVPARKNADLVCHSFQHHPGVFYRLRYRRSMLPTLPATLAGFLTQIKDTCPHPVFTAPTNARASAQELPHHVAYHNDKAADVVRLAAASVSYQPYKTRHENLERYFLEQDEHTIATEVPVWSLGEDPRFSTLTGHIDVLRFKDRRIEVWDYKPDARAEKMAAVQVQLYCEMLARRTGLPLTDFVAGYFDETDGYAFEPASFKFL